MGFSERTLSGRELFLVRLILAAVWFYNGTYLKLILVDPEHLKVVEAVGQVGPLSPANFLFLIGLGETLLGLWILSGVFYKWSCGLQFSLIVAMNVIGILSGGVDSPASLVITNLPLLACIWMAYRLGPGAVTE